MKKGEIDLLFKNNEINLKSYSNDVTIYIYNCQVQSF